MASAGFQRVDMGGSQNQPAGSTFNQRQQPDLWLARGLICCLDKRVLSIDRTTSCRTPDLVFRGSIFSDVQDMLND